MIKELVVISGKGGTGKTSVLAAFASLAENGVLCDADVDAADLHLLMNPTVRQSHDFQGGGTAIINRDICTECGLCRDLCRWDAINESYHVDGIACEGCGVCVDLCPEHAIDFPVKTCGQWFISDTRFGTMVHARLGIAEENSGKLVTLIRQEAKKLAKKNQSTLILTDGPPGIGCPVIASIGGAAAILIIAEPTVSGLHDMQRVAQLARHFKVPGMVVVNKFDLNRDKAQAIEDLAEKEQMAILGRIPFDPVFTTSMIQGETLLEVAGQSKTGKTIKRIWEKIMRSPEMTGN